MVGSVYSIHTANWRSRSLPAGSAYHGSQLQFDDLDVAFPWLTGERGEDLRTMSLAFVLMEARGATVISHLVDAIDAAIRHDLPEASNALVDLARAVGEMAAVFVVVVRPKLIAVDHWLEWIQPHGGWAVDTGDGESHLGASGLQVGALQCLDIALGVGGDSTIARGYRPARRYLPSRFQAFLEALDAVAHVLPEFVESSRSATVKQAHADCLGEMQRFRRAHKARGAQYLSGDVPGHAPRRSTGLSTPYRGGADPVTAFEATMQERIDETGAARLETDLDDAGVAATFQYLTEPELRALLACGHDERALAGQVIFAAGENLDSLYRLDDGMLRVLDADGALVGRIWPGEVFGEIELLTAGHATTTVIADVDAELRNIPHRELFDLLRSDPNLTSRFYQSLAALLARRLEATMALIRDTAPQPGASDIDLRDADAGASQRA
jgi:CRP-like cAMP-binding protein